VRRSAAEELARSENAAAVIREVSAYKAEVAGFYFVPSILRCIVGYRVAARNYIQSLVQRGRQLDAEIDGDFGLLAPLQRDDPRARGRRVRADSRRARRRA